MSVREKSSDVGEASNEIRPAGFKCSASSLGIDQPVKKLDDRCSTKRIKKKRRAVVLPFRSGVENAKRYFGK